MATHQPYGLPFIIRKKGNDNTNEFDTIFPTYNIWEEIPVSTLKFYSNTSQICYIALPVHRSTNNWINHAECFSECAGQKT